MYQDISIDARESKRFSAENAFERIANRLCLRVFTLLQARPPRAGCSKIPTGRPTVVGSPYNFSVFDTGNDARVATICCGSEEVGIISFGLINNSKYFDF